MDYILKKLNSRINILKNIKSSKDLIVYYQSRLEYQLILLLGYLWNMNLENLDDIDKENIYRIAQRPTIGDIVDMCKRLDVQNLFKANKKVAKSLQNYPFLRNSFIGHGYTYADGQENVINQFEELYNFFIESSISCVKIHNSQGWPLYKAICQQKLAKFSSGTRQNIAGGLYNYTDVLARIQRYDDAIEVCEYILVNPPTNFHAQFMRRKEWIQKIRTNNRK